MKKLILTLTIFSVFENCSFAQETIRFTKDEPTKSKSTKKKKGSSEQNIIKIAPLAFIGGNFPVFYERSITSTFAMQVGLGITSKNYIYDALSEASDNSGGIYGAETILWKDGTIDTYNDESYGSAIFKRKSKLGYFISLEPKIYFEDEGLEGSFISFNFNTARYNNTVPTVKNGLPYSSSPTLTGTTYNGYYKITNFLVNWGSQTLYDHISLEYSVGLGLKKVKTNTYAFGTDNSNKYIDGVGSTDATTLGYNIAFRVGYHF
jgi:hypothetical protein